MLSFLDSGEVIYRRTIQTNIHSCDNYITHTLKKIGRSVTTVEERFAECNKNLLNQKILVTSAEILLTVKDFLRFDKIIRI